jgi:hypothetical protein
MNPFLVAEPWRCDVVPSMGPPDLVYPEPNDPATEWKFGDGQTGADERAEISEAAAAGRLTEYTEAQAVHRAHASRTRTHSAVAKSRPLVTPDLGEGRQDHDENEMRGLLRSVRDGRLVVPSAALPDLPNGATGAMRAVADFAATMIGLHHFAGRPGHTMLSARFVAEHTGVVPMTACRALNALVKAGVLRDEGDMPVMSGMPRGTRLFSAGSVDPPDDLVEIDDQATSDSVDDLLIDGDLELDRSLVLEGLSPLGPDAVELGVVEDEGAVAVSVGPHAQRGYARRPTTAQLTDIAVARATVGTRDGTAFWLACQLRDAGVTPRAARDALLAYQRRVPQEGHPFTVGEALRKVDSAYRRPPRAAWDSGTMRPTCPHLEHATSGQVRRGGLRS